MWYNRIRFDVMYVSRVGIFVAQCLIFMSIHLLTIANKIWKCGRRYDVYIIPYGSNEKVFCYAHTVVLNGDEGREINLHLRDMCMTSRTEYQTTSDDKLVLETFSWGKSFHIYLHSETNWIKQLKMFLKLCTVCSLGNRTISVHKWGDRFKSISNRN